MESVKYMSNFHDTGVMCCGFQVNWHNVTEEKGQTIDLDAFANDVTLILRVC